MHFNSQVHMHWLIHLYFSCSLFTLSLGTVFSLQHLPSYDYTIQSLSIIGPESSSFPRYSFFLFLFHVHFQSVLTLSRCTSLYLKCNFIMFDSPFAVFTTEFIQTKAKFTFCVLTNINSWCLICCTPLDAWVKSKISIKWQRKKKEKNRIQKIKKTYWNENRYGMWIGWHMKYGTFCFI